MLGIVGFTISCRNLVSLPCRKLFKKEKKKKKKRPLVDGCFERDHSSSRIAKTMGATSSHERHPRLLFHPYVSRVPLEIVRVGTFRRKRCFVLMVAIIVPGSSSSTNSSRKFSVPFLHPRFARWQNETVEQCVHEKRESASNNRGLYEKMRSYTVHY